MFLGIDIGTSSVKALIMDEAGVGVFEASAPLSVSRPHPLWSEQDPEAWWQATIAAVGALPSHARAQVRGVGLSGQMHGAVLLDEADRVLRPAILWNDGRAHLECAELEARVLNLTAVTGNRAMPGFTAPKLLWLAKHEPEIFARVRCVLLPKDYIRLRLTGEKASDMSDSAGTLWLDVGARDWSDVVLGACDLSRTHMPRLFEGHEKTGVVRAEAAAVLGLPRVPVAAGGGDNAASAVGMGVLAQGQGFLSLGTSGVLFVGDQTFKPMPEAGVHTFCHAVPNTWHRMAVVLSAASAVDSVARMAGYASTAAAVAVRGDARADDPLFLPYLSGERTPHNNPHASGVFFGLSHDTDPRALVRAALEGVAFAMADGFDALHRPTLEALTLVGGGARIAGWAELLASAFNHSLILRAGAEQGAAFGAARLGRLCVTGEDPKDVCTPPPIARTVSPNAELVDRLAPRRALFQRLYQNLRPAFQEHRS